MSYQDSPKKIKICFISSDGETVQSFMRYLSAPIFDVTVISSLNQLSREEETLKTISGLVIDLQTEISASTEEKDFIRAFKRSSQQPLLEIAVPGLNNAAEEIELYKTQLQDFLNLAVQYSAEAEVRAHPRRNRILKVKIRGSLDAGAPVVKAVTSDLSEGGCFVVNFGDWTNLKELFLEIGESGVNLPCRIAWDRKWEQTNNKFPGFGAQFIDLTDETRKELTRILAEWNAQLSR